MTPTTILRASTVALEIAHRGLDGRLHGHSLTIEVWTAEAVDLDAWHARLQNVAATMEGQIERTIAGRTFEDVAAAVLDALPEAVRVVVALPSRGHKVDAIR